MSKLLNEIASARENSDEVLSDNEVQSALDRLARELQERLKDSNPVILCVMNGGLIVTGELLRRIDFLHQLDYVHATRYRGATTGKDVVWKARPSISLAGRCVLVVDDILDEGHTLKAIINDCYSQGASEVISAVLVEKKHSRRCDVHADHIGLSVPDRYVYGYGMDYKGYLRNCKGIYAVSD